MPNRKQFIEHFIKCANQNNMSCLGVSIDSGATPPTSLLVLQDVGLSKNLHIALTDQPCLLTTGDAMTKLELTLVNKNDSGGPSIAAYRESFYAQKASEADEALSLDRAWQSILKLCEE